VSLIRILAAVFLLVVIPVVQAAEEAQLEASPAIFSVLAAVNAAGYDADLDSPNNHSLRLQIRQELAKKNIPVLNDLRRFVRDHRKPSSGADLSQYISFALTVDGPPGFTFRLRQNEVPPDVEALEGFQKLMVQFHEQAGIEELWQRSQPVFEQAMAQYHEGVSRGLLEVNGYMRNVGSGFLGRRFQVYLDVLGAPNQVHTRSYGDDYFVVLTPSAEPKIDDVRHAYMHYLLDPLFTKYSEQVFKKRSLIDFAHGAPALEEVYKNDFLLLATESMVKALESRLEPAGRRQAMVDRALREGFILTPFFAEQLPVFEKQEQAMRFFFPDLISEIDLKRETRRLDKVEFAATRAERIAKAPPVAPTPEVPKESAAIEAADQLYTERRLQKAREAYLAILQANDNQPLHSRAYYGLARIATHENNPEVAERLFQKTLELSPEPQVKTWTHVYLGKLAAIARDLDGARRQFEAALGVDGGSDAARAAARKGLEDLTIR
jgi:tetratricopeptide (TPR) repeat protein